MINFYIITTLISWALVSLWVLMLQKDRSKSGKKSETTFTAGQKIAMAIKLTFYMLLPVFNLFISVYAWFKYDEVLKESIQEVTITND